MANKATSRGATAGRQNQTAPDARARMRHAWMYSGNHLQVAVGPKLTTYTKSSPQNLKELIYSKHYLKAPRGDADLYYSAQLFHYGLPQGNGVEEAINIFKAAFASLAEGEQLAPTATILNLKEALKAEYNETERRGHEANQARIAEIQRELDEIESAKQRGEQLRLELEALSTKIPKKPKASDTAVIAPADSGPANVADDNEEVAQQGAGKVREALAVHDKDTTPVETEKKRKKGQQDRQEETPAKKSKHDQPKVSLHGLGRTLFK